MTALRAEEGDDLTATIRGERVALRPANHGFSLEEQQLRYSWSQDKELQYWSGSIPSAATFAEFQRLLPERDWPSDGKRRSYAILDSPDRLIGMVSCYGIDWGAGTGELGVYIGAREKWGQGLGTDAVMTLLRHLFSDLDFRHIYLNTFASNMRALKSYAKVGFRRVGNRRRFRPSIGYYREVRMVIERDSCLSMLSTQEQVPRSEGTPSLPVGSGTVDS